MFFPSLRTLIVLAMVAVFPGSIAAAAEDAFLASKLDFKSIFAAKPGDRAAYCLLGNGFFRTIHSDDVESIIRDWLAAHPNAQAIPVTRRPDRVVYVLIEDGADNLNVALVRAGAFPARVMIDAAYHTAAPSDGTAKANERLMARERYLAYVERVGSAQAEAKREQLGIWSEQYKDARELERLE